jgi:iron complex outermembrane receptor protein
MRFSLVQTSSSAVIFHPAKPRFFAATALLLILFRIDISSSPSPSQYLNIDGYSILNGRAGFKTQKGITLFASSRNLSDAGHAGHFAAVLGNSKIWGLTLRYN